MDALGAFPIVCRRQWRTPNTRVRTMHVEHQMENMFPKKAEIQYWGHCGIGNVPPKIVKLTNIHQRLTRQKIRMDNLSSRRSALAKKSASFEIRKSASSRREVIHAHLLAREALMNVRKFDNHWKDIAYPAISPILYLRFLGEHVLHLVLHVHCVHSGIRRAPLASTSDWKSAQSVHAEH